MRDTSPEIAARYRELLLGRSPEDRLRIGCSMHAMARALVRASVLARNPSASPGTLRRALFLSFYGQDFSEGERERIAAWLGREEPPPDLEADGREGQDGRQSTGTSGG